MHTYVYIYVYWSHEHLSFTQRIYNASKAPHTDVFFSLKNEKNSRVARLMSSLLIGADRYKVIIKIAMLFFFEIFETCEKISRRILGKRDIFISVDVYMWVLACLVLFIWIFDDKFLVYYQIYVNIPSNVCLYLFSSLGAFIYVYVCMYMYDVHIGYIF